MPKISVIVPIYNTEKYLKKCIDSLLNQTLEDIEIVLVNDGSPDNSQAVIDEYVALYPDKIKSFNQENKGQAAARNLGISKATGEFLGFVDSDDYMEPEGYLKSYNYAIQNNLDIVCFALCEENEGEKNPIKLLHDECENDVRYILNTPSPCNKIVRRTVFTENNLKFAENYIYEDLELIPKLVLYSKKIGFIEESFYNYIIHPDSTMRQKKYNPKLASIYYVMESLKKQFEKTAYKSELEYMFIEHLMHSAVLRYLDYREGSEDIIKIADIMKKSFPKWYKNPYFKKEDIKYKIFCWLVYLKKPALLKKLLSK